MSNHIPINPSINQPQEEEEEEEEELLSSVPSPIKADEHIIVRGGVLRSRLAGAFFLVVKLSVMVMVMACEFLSSLDKLFWSLS